MKKTHKALITDTALENMESVPSKFITKILDSIELLESFPEIGFIIRNPKWKGYRQLIVDYYRVIYTIQEDKKLIFVHFIKHGKMNFP